MVLLLAAVVDWWVRRPEVGAEGAVWIHGWCRRIVKVLGFRCEVEGWVPAGGAVVSNHLSYLDILLYSSVRPFVMVAKTEVRGWPLLGWITSRAGTVYVERGGGPKTYPRVNAAMAEAYRSGLPVLFFPEGTTTDGAECVAVSARAVSLGAEQWRSAADCGVAVFVGECAVNRGATVGEDVCWWGEMGFVCAYVSAVGVAGVSVKVRFGDEVLERRIGLFCRRRRRRGLWRCMRGACGEWDAAG